MGRIIASRVFAAVGAVLAAGVMWACTVRKDAAAWVVGPADGAAECMAGFAEQLSRGNFAAATQFLVGSPKLDLPEEPGNETEMQLWNAFAESLECVPMGPVFPTSSGLAGKVQLRYLDLSAAADAMQEKTQTLLETRVAAAEEMTEVYTQDHEYRPDFLNQLLADAAEEAIAAAPNGEQVLTLHLLFQDGRWAIVPDEMLLRALSGKL